MCAFCNQDHFSSECYLSVPRRLEIATREGRCYNCLGKGHLLPDCNSRGTCRRCHGKHHTALCKKIDKSASPAVNAAQSKPASTAAEKASTEVKIVTVSCLTCNSTDEDALLQYPNPNHPSSRYRTNLIPFRRRLAATTRRSLVNNQGADDNPNARQVN